MSADQALEARPRPPAGDRPLSPGPVLLASLMAGVAIGVVQAATQVNEASISFIAKAGAIVLVLVTLGPMLASHALSYTRASLLSIEHVVH